MVFVISVTDNAAHATLLLPIQTNLSHILVKTSTLMKLDVRPKNTKQYKWQFKEISAELERGGGPSISLH